MELGDEENYATAALFTLATYCTLYETGVARGQGPGGWGVPFDDICNAYSGAACPQSNGWGWHIVAPRGILGGVYQQLAVKASAMPGLIACVDPVHPLSDPRCRDALASMVEAHAQRLDAGLAFSAQASEAAVLGVSESGAAPDVDDAAANLSGGSSAKSLPALDTASAEELSFMHRPAASAPECIAAGPDPAADDDTAVEAALRASLMRLQQRPGGQEEVATRNRRLEANGLTEGAVLPQSAFAPARMYVHNPSPESIAALAQVVSACIRPDLEARAAPRWYDARARVAVKRLAHWLCVPAGTLDALEAHAMSQMPADGAPAAGGAASWRSYYSKSSKWIKVGAAAVGGATLMAVTAGLAAPAIIAGVGTAVGMTASAGAGAAIAGAASTAPAVGIVSGSMGAAGAAHYSSKMAWRTADVKAMGFVRLCAWDRWQQSKGASANTGESAGAADRSQPLGREGAASSSGADEAQALLPDESSRASQGSARQARPSQRDSSSPESSKRAAWSSWGKKKRAQDAGAAAAGLQDPLKSPLPTPLMDRESIGHAGLLIAVNGSIGTVEDFVAPWASLPRKYGDAYALVWEEGPLIEVGQAFVKLIAKNGAQFAAQWALSASVLTSGLVAAMAWPIGVLSAASFIDSAWDVASNRATLAGQLLAHMLIARAHGDRPVTLVGVSLGARLVFHCCLELYKQGALGIVEHVVLLGAPVSVNADRWRLVRSVVAGRFVNGYSALDWTLALMYRSTITGQGLVKRVAGLSAASVAGVEDVDLADIVKGHADYLKVMDQILAVIDLRRAAELTAD